MISKKIYDELKEKYGSKGSWTIWNKWDDGDTTFKSNLIDQMDWAKDEDNLIASLNDKYVFVALNKSENKKKARKKNVSDKPSWINFHGGTKDFNLRYALQSKNSKADSVYKGSYITDIIKTVKSKECIGTKSSDVVKSVNKDDELENIKTFKQEIAILGNVKVLIALGSAAFKYLNKYQHEFEGIKIIRVPHYAVQGGFWTSFYTQYGKDAKKSEPESYKQMFFDMIHKLL